MFIYNLRKIILIYLFILLPLIDMVNGYLVINKIISEGGAASPSQIGRMLAIILIFYYFLLEKIAITKIFIFTIFFLSIEIISSFFHQSFLGFITGMTTAYKLVYFYSLIILMPLLLKNREQLLYFAKIIEINLYLISFSILIALITGLGNSTYGWGLGTKGFFASGNSIGIYLGSMSLVYLFLIKKKIISNIKKITFLFIPLSLLILSSKTALLISSIILLYWVSITRMKILIIPFLICAITIYYDKIIPSIGEVFEVIISRYNSSDDFLFFIVSGRNDYVFNAFDLFFSQEPSFIRYIFGMGSFVSYQNFSSSELIYHTLETDIFDVFFMYGFIGCIIYFSIFYYLFQKVYHEKILLLSFSLIFFHSLLAGHVIFNGMSVIAIATILAVSIFLNENKDNVKNNF